MYTAHILLLHKHMQQREVNQMVFVDKVSSADVSTASW